MSARVKRSLSALELLKNSNPSVRKLIIRSAKPELIDAISEICFNYLRGNIGCSGKQFKELARHKNCLREIVGCRLKSVNKQVNKSSNKGGRRKERYILTQKGDGFWTALLTPLVSELTSFIISKALKK